MNNIEKTKSTYIKNKKINSDKNKRKLVSVKYYSPLTLLATLVIIIFFSEILIMFIFPVLPLLPILTMALIDSTLLVILIFPILYFVFFRPLHIHISERIQAERSLLESEGKYRSLTDDVLDSSTVGIFILDSEFRIVWINQAMEHFFNIKRSEVIGRDKRNLIRRRIKNVFEDPELFAGKVLATYDNNTYVESFECHVLPDVGRKERWLEHCSQPIHSGLYTGGRIEHYYEITERKKAEAALRHYRSHLEELIKERTAELESFTYSVSHDLRAPVRAIDGFSKILVEDYADILDTEGNRILNLITGNTRKMGQLIDDLLMLSRLGKKKMKRVKIEMSDLMKDAQAEVIKTVTDRNIRWEINKLYPAWGDTTSIRQVWVNLLSNAVKFTRPKKTAIIEIGSKSDESGTVYYVKDNGVGFDMQYMDKLFGVFQRLHTEEEFEGTGVGLAIVKRIVRRHHGRVWAEGGVDKGAIFYFSLPK